MSNLFALVIEDSQTQAIILAEALQAAGFEVEIIADGDTALTRLAAVIPDIVVLDMHLPGASGIEILQRIRADVRLAKTRVIIVTMEPQMAEAVQDEADLVLLKPIDFAQLRDLAARLRPPTSPGG